jgi:serine/threonine-protein kinase RsbW
MRVPTAKSQLSRTPADGFIGREVELERLYLRSVSGDGRRTLNVTGPAHSGVSELLRQLYDRLFFGQRFVIPFYFALDAKDENSYNASSRFLYQFILQSIAFRRREPALVTATPDICELAKLAPLQDAAWVNQMCEVCRNEGPLNDERAFIRSALNAPFRASTAGNFQTLVIVDDIYESVRLQDGEVFFNEIRYIADRANAALIIGSRQSSEALFLRSEIFNVERLGRLEISDLIAATASELSVQINDESRDLIAVQLGPRPGLIEAFLQAARSKRSSLESYREVERLYTDELHNGIIGRYFDHIFAKVISDPLVRQRLFDELFFTIADVNESFPIDALKEKLGTGDAEFSDVVDQLRSEELLVVDNGFARLADDAVLRDFLIARHRNTASQKAPAAAAAFTVTNALKRAPKVMSRTYRRESALGLANILSEFDLQTIPRSLIDYRVYRDELKGLTDTEVRSKITTAGETITLPQIAHSAPIVDHLAAFGNPIEPERAALGVGFSDRSYSDDAEIVWLASEIDSKLEADPALTLEWCARLEKAAADLGYPNFKLWLVAPEGFSDAALDILSDRKGYGSSREQARLLKNFLAGDASGEAAETAVYEMVVPVGGETELVAAHALEEIARRFEYPAKAVNQMKTALVEACINAAEHGHTPDRKIRLIFAVDAAVAAITVSNRGLRLTDREHTIAADEPADTRRGWGLGLIRSLMDDVRVESVDDGTRIVMTKNIRPTK